jgi:hypothetical protein
VFEVLAIGIVGVSASGPTYVSGIISSDSTWNAAITNEGNDIAMPAEGGLMINWNIISIIVTIIIGVAGLIITLYFGLKPLKNLDRIVTKKDLIAAIHAFGRANKENRFVDTEDLRQGYTLAGNFFGSNVKDVKIPTTRKKVLATILDGGGNYPMVEEEETIPK